MILPNQYSMIGSGENEAENYLVTRAIIINAISIMIIIIIMAIIITIIITRLGR